LSDGQLAAFISAGRGVDDPQNTSKVPMPPKGGRMDFGDQNIADVVTYLRGLSDSRRAPAGRLPAVEVVIGDGSSASPTIVAAVPAPPEKSEVQAPLASSVAAIQAGLLDPQAVMRGKKAFISCMACHGRDANGVKNMGKTLVDSPFVSRLDNKALVDFIKKGRGPTDPGNTTKIAMPPKGGNPALKDEQITDIVAYIRSLNGGTVAAASAVAAPAPVAAPALAQTNAPAALSAPVAPPLAFAAPSAPAPAPTKVTAIALGDPITRGKKSFISCMACHGKDATGVKNMGKDLVHSVFVARLSDDALVDFIKKGRGPTDPENTTKIGMPPKGGNPALKDEQIRDIVAYIRSLRQTSASAE
jgi:disulfide bond formation protein DsbB